MWSWYGHDVSLCCSLSNELNEYVDLYNKFYLCDKGWKHYKDDIRIRNGPGNSEKEPESSKVNFCLKKQTYKHSLVK